jgi:ribosomal protein S15P/S13E
MAQVLATMFLIVVAAGIAKMVFDVQIAKLERTIEDLKKHFDEN